jgi:hypothetical protein
MLCSTTAEVYEEGHGRWRRFPCSLPHNSQQLHYMGSMMIGHVWDVTLMLLMFCGILANVP